MMHSLLGLVLTVGCYYGCKRLYRRFRYVILTPMITCLVLVAVILLAAHISYNTYMISGKLLMDMLGPATVALAIPLYKNRDILKKYLVEFLISLISGSVVALVSSVLLARILGLDPNIWSSVAPRSVTTPIAINISQTIGGIPTLTAVFVIITALCGILIGPLLIRLLHIQSPIGRGTLLGMGAHGIGTSRAFEFGQLEGTCASLSMVLAAGITFVLAPLLIPLVS